MIKILKTEEPLRDSRGNIAVEFIPSEEFLEPVDGSYVDKDVVQEVSISSKEKRMWSRIKRLEALLRKQTRYSYDTKRQTFNILPNKQGVYQYSFCVDCEGDYCYRTAGDNCFWIIEGGYSELKQLIKRITK